MMKDPEFRKMFAEIGFVESFLDKLDSEMKSQKISRVELARRLDFSTQKINHMFSGEIPLSYQEMTEMAHYLDCNIEIEIIRRKE